MRRLSLLSLLCLAIATSAEAQQAMATAPELAALRARADTAWRAERHAHALALYDSVLILEPSSSLAVFRRATLLSYVDRLDEAVAGFRRYVSLEPRDEEGRIALARTLAWASRYDESVALYDSVLARDATYRTASLGGAQALAWASRFRESIARHEAWIRANPNDDEARLALARTLAWAGRLDESERIYRDVATKGGSAEAQKGIARVLGWRGALLESEAQWRVIATQSPRDPEAWTGLAQVLRWQGRPEAAAAALRQALAVRPGDADARAQLSWVLAELRPSLEPSVTGATDSDRNRTTLYSISGGAAAPWHGRFTGIASHRIASFGGTESRASTLRGVATWSDRPGRLSARGELGAVRLASERADVVGDETTSRDMLLASARLVARPGARIGIGVTGARMPFDETALLIARGIVVSSAGADAELALPGRLALSAAGEIARITGGATENARRAGSAALRWNQSRRWSVGIAGRAFGYDSTTHDGYFAPERYTLMEGNARLELGKELGINGGIEGGLGTQTIRLSGGEPSSRAAQRARGWLTWRPVPGYEVVGTLGWANVASPGQVRGGDYSATTFSIGGRVKL